MRCLYLLHSRILMHIDKYKITLGTLYEHLHCIRHVIIYYYIYTYPWGQSTLTLSNDNIAIHSAQSESDVSCKK